MYYNVFEKKGIYYYSFKEEVTGKTITQSIRFHPTVGTYSDIGTYKDIYGNKVEKNEFKNSYEYKKFIKANNQLCGVIDPIYQFISHKFGKEEVVISTPDVWFLDIEVYSTDNFPEAKDALYMINALTLYSVLEDRYITISLKEYKTKESNVSYFEAVNEQHLLEAFIKIIEKKNIQILSGWNVIHFDMKYILNRMRNKFYENNYIVRNWIDENTDSYTKELKTIQVVDYEEVYKNFSKPIDLYNLDFVAEHELGEGNGKIKDEMPLWQLYDEKFEKFIDYNIHDVRLLAQIDKKRKLLETIMELCNNMLILPKDVFSPVASWNSYLYNYLGERGIMLPQEHNPKRKIIGGFVGSLPYGAGRYYNVVIADIESSYPHQIMEFNISPETWIKPKDLPEELRNFRNNKLGFTIKKEIEDNTKSQEFVDRLILLINDEDFCEELLGLLRKYKVTMGGNGEFYKLDRVGILPENVEVMFKIRKNAKNKAEQLEEVIHEIDEIIKNAK
jgi:DNA polymerase elongation subunit (family B)